MAKIGRVKGSLDSDTVDKVVLTPDEIEELVGLLEAAKDSATDSNTEKALGAITLEADDQVIKVGTIKVKRESEED